jgi:hypothetical protein
MGLITFKKRFELFPVKDNCEGNSLKDRIDNEIGL